ncbi:MAG: DUF4982 domain-containing protein [Prevotella fusca]|uniref:DUF4982 domain-containing protein n=1 Tax=Prevotella fusca TaxID=589436 RepID=UPI003F9F1202
MKTRIFITLLLICHTTLNCAQNRVTELRTWKFSHDSLHWQTVNIPHDWAISGPFDKKWDLQCVAIEQNGEKQATEKSGRSGALPWIGEGWYSHQLTIKNRKDFSHAYLCFDGAMSEPIVYINGKEVGRWAYGYNAFRIDATKYLKKGENTIIVHLNNREESSRWYPGAGLYRPVRLVLTPEMRIDPWNVYIRTTRLDDAGATLSIDAKVDGWDGKKKLIAIAYGSVDGQSEQTELTLDPLTGIAHAELKWKKGKYSVWTPEQPVLIPLGIYTRNKGTLIPLYTTKTAVRTVSVSKEKGFQLNGVSRKIQGVCLHHDLGPLGAAENKAALIRQIKQMKDMGADAIRTAHNMPSELFAQLCDSLGMMVMAESFDMWVYPKCKNGYARFFNDWADKDIENLVRHHRNHPSIVMWSIGNEIPEQWSEEGRQIAGRLQEICHRLDPSRPVTQGMDRAEEALKAGFAQVMDVPGFNYRVYKYNRNIAQLPKGFLLGSETASTVSSRGVYKFPVRWGVAEAEKDGQVSSYDTQWCSWSNLPEEDFIAMEDLPYTIGQFIWTGTDYLGEPTPYDEYWPSRSSYFGACDLAGLPKDRYYLYRAVWNRNKPTLHLLPHWTWNGREGQVTPVFCYSSYPETELFVNGKSQGRRRKAGKEVQGEAATGKAATPEEARQRAERYRMIWDNVVYEPGELKVVAYDEQGKAADSVSVYTAGKPHKLLLEPDKSTCGIPGTNLVYITVTMLDEQGNPVPDADNELFFTVSGAGRFKAVCNGDPTSLESFTEPQMKLFHGKLVITLEGNNMKGNITLTVHDKGQEISERIIIHNTGNELQAPDL